MKFSDIEVLVKHLSDPIKKYVSNLVNPINKKIESLENSLNNIKTIDVDDIALTAAGLIDKPKDGLDGKDGANGLDGKDGKDGANGKDGLDGKSFLDHIKELGYGSFEEFKKSIQGLDGKNGINGQNGENGKSFIEQLPELGYPTIEDFISSLKGIGGKDGKNGIDGQNGIDGKSFLEYIKELGYVSFEEFKDSIKGHDGKDGENGVDGKDGMNGIDGLNGQDGINGKDALDIDILPEINESETYQRGTYATHNGGLWRSHQTTKGLRGWECIVNGISEIEIEQVDDRNFKLKLTKSDNNVIEKSFAMPVMIYKGVFKSGESYQKGDTVTWGGSMWHCDADTTDKPGELESKGWTLATKRGRDGKDKQ